MTIHTYDDATIYVDGEPWIGGAHVVASEVRAAYDEAPPPVSYTASMTFTIGGAHAAALLAMFQPAPRGASVATLVRRSEYGGRKGRRALRRLWAMVR